MWALAERAGRLHALVLVLDGASHRDMVALATKVAESVAIARIMTRLLTASADVSWTIAKVVLLAERCASFTIHVVIWRRASRIRTRRHALAILTRGIAGSRGGR